MAKNTFFKTYTVPTSYEEKIMEAKRRQVMADALQASAAVPEGEFTYQGFRAQPSVAAALARGLQGFMGNYQRGISGQLEQEAAKQDKQSTDNLIKEFTQTYNPSPAPVGPPPAPEGDPGFGGYIEPPTPAVEVQAAPVTPAEIRARQISAVLKNMSAGGRTGQLAPSLLSLIEKPERVSADVQAKIEADKERDKIKAGAPSANAQDLIDAGFVPGTTAFENAMKARNNAANYHAPPAREHVPGEDTFGMFTVNGVPRYMSAAAASAAQNSGSTVSVAEKLNKLTSGQQKIISDSKTQITGFNEGIKTAQKFIDAIENGDLPLNAFTSAKYAAESVFSDGTGPETEAYVRFANLKSFVSQQVQEILSLAKGPQTDADAKRAKEIILANFNNGAIVKSQLRILQKLFKDKSSEAANTISDTYELASVENPNETKLEELTPEEKEYARLKARDKANKTKP